MATPTLTSGLLNCIESHLLKPLTRAQKVGLYGRVMLYVFGGCKQGVVRKFVASESIPLDYPNWKKTLRARGDLYKHSKLYLYSQFVPGKELTQAQAEITLKEKNALMLATEYQPLAGRLTYICKKLKCHPLSLKEMDKFYAKALTSQEIVGYAERFVYTKLRFLAQSYGFSMKELHRHVITSAYGAYLKQYPVFENYDHLLKLAKVAIHNSGINLILKETSDKRNKLVQLEDGSYSAVVSSLTDNNLSFNAAEDGYTRTSYLVTGLDGAVASEWESVFALRELLASNKLTPRHKKFLHLMLNHPSIDFQEYLGADQDDLYNQNFNTYQKKVMQFMNIQPSAAERFLESLKPLL